MPFYCIFWEKNNWSGFLYTWMKKLHAEHITRPNLPLITNIIAKWPWKVGHKGQKGQIS